MRWANSAGTKEGDTKIFRAKSGEYKLLSANGFGGYVEFATGSFKEMRDFYEQTFYESEKDFDWYAEERRREQRRYNGGDELYENRRDDEFVDGQTGRELSTVNIRTGNEIGSSGDKGQSVKYSLRDSDGNELSEKQSEYFKNSKVRDENGNLLVMYHGTPHDFTVFKNRGSGMYFTADPEYAYGYTQLNGKVMKVYLNITKPFDILKDSKAKKIFIDSSNALYVDSNKKRVTNWNKRTGLLLPVGISIDNSTDSISQTSENVKKNSFLFVLRLKKQKDWLQFII